MAVAGIGTEIISIGRIRNLISGERKNRFVQRIFTSKEKEYCQDKKSPWIHYAGIFAAKEAVRKVLKASWEENLTWRDVEVLPRGNGTPVVSLHHNTKRIVQSRRISKILLSISHGREYAVACCIAETDGQG